MPLRPPPVQEPIKFPLPQTWVLWLQSIFEDDTGFNGTFLNGDGDTVTVVNGKITDVS